MAPIERPDWGDGESRALVPAEPSKSVDVVDLTPDQVIAQMQGEPPSAGHDVSSHPPGSADPIAAIPQEQLERAAFVADQILADHPERASFEAKFDELSAPLQAKVFRLLATSPHLRGEDLLVELEGKLTLEEMVEAKAWGRSLSLAHKQLLLG